MAGPAFETGFTKIEAPKLKDYGAALNPIADNFKRLSDIELKKQELEEKRAFQVSREKTLNQWQKDAEALKVKTNATAAEKLGEVQKSIHKLDNTSRELIADGQNKTSITNNKLTNRTNKENSILTNRTSRGNSIRSTNASVAVGKGHDTARVKSSQLSKDASDYRIDYSKGGKSYIDKNLELATANYQNEKEFGAVSLSTEEYSTPKYEFGDMETYFKNNKEANKINKKIQLNIEKFKKDNQEIFKSLSLEQLDLLNKGELVALRESIKDESFETKEQYKERLKKNAQRGGRTTGYGHIGTGSFSKKPDFSSEKEHAKKREFGKVVKVLDSLISDKKALNAKFNKEKGRHVVGQRKHQRVSIAKSIDDNSERKKRAMEIFRIPEAKQTDAEKKELKRLNYQYALVSKLINQYQLEVNKRLTLDKELENNLKLQTESASLDLSLSRYKVLNEASVSTQGITGEQKIELKDLKKLLSKAHGKTKK